MDEQLVDLEDRGLHLTNCALAEHCCSDDCRSYGCHTCCDCYFEDGKPDEELELIRLSIRCLD
jgi:hypothetical protein